MTEPVDDPTERGPQGVRRSRGRWRPFLIWGLPSLLVFVLTLWPVATGSETFVLRDVLDVHVMMLAPQVDALEQGVLPVIDPARSGGQPATGNPNSLPFYPTRLLFLVLPFFAAFGLHFVLHLVLAIPAMAWLGRTWGLSRPAAWAAGVSYGFSGFALSQANFYNLVTSLALIPAFVAVCLGFARPRGRAALRIAGAAVLWALLLVSGDPMMAGLGLVLATSALLVHGVRLPQRWRRPRKVAAQSEVASRRRWPGLVGGVVAALGVGALLALPQLVEFSRIVGTSFRGVWRFGADALATYGAWNPMALLEWLIPTLYGRIDLPGIGRVWALDWFAGNPPLYLSLAPGLVPLAWVLLSGLPRNRRAVWAWGSIAVGIFFALGSLNPLVVKILQLPGFEAFRYPVKMWPLVAVPLGVLAGVGFERTFGGLRGVQGMEGEGRPRLRRFTLVLAGLGLAVVVFMGVMLAVPGAAEALIATGAPEGSLVERIAAVERARWTAQAVVVVASVLAALGLLVLARRRPGTAAALLLVLHAASQLFLLRPLLATADTTLLAEPPPVFEALREAAGERDLADLRLVHGDYLDLFGTPTGPVALESRPRGYYEMPPWAGVLHGLRYEGNRSPEGLDSFLLQMGRVFMSQTDDRSRIAALETWGATHLLLTHPLDEEVSADDARLVASLAPVPEQRQRPLYLYELPGSTPEVFFAELAVPTPHVNAAWQLMVHPDFDPERLALTTPGPDGMEPVDDPERLAGLVAESRRLGDGRVRLLSQGDEALTARVDSPRGGLLVTRRSHLPIWKASIDGEEAPTEVVNMSRLGVRVPPGEHRVRLWVDRRPLMAASAGSGVGLVLLLGLLVWGFVRGRRS